MKGFFHRILVVDLSSRSHRVEDVPEQAYRDYLGGKGLGTWLLLEENPRGVDPLAPENNLIFATGPLTDLRVHGSARHGVFTKSPLTGLYSESYSGGTVADRISRTGYDAVVITGASKDPVRLAITDKKVEFIDAKDLWGMETYEADRAVAETADDPRGLITIGPAGENLVRFATIANNRHRCAGRTGVGAVMGSKKLKAIAFSGSARREPADPAALERHWKLMIERSRTDVGVRNYKKYGTVQMVAMANETGTFPTRYWQSGKRDDYEDKLSGEALYRRCKVQPHACPRCFMACGKMSEVRTGPYRGLTIEGPEYETIYAFAGLAMIDTIEEVMHLNDLCNRLGIDTITAGNLVAFAMRASELGAIDEKIEYGDTAAAAELLERIAAREGLGGQLSDGIVAAAKKWGLEDEAVHVKGLEPAGYDPRPLKGMALAYAVCDRGACHLRSTFYKAEFAGLSPPDELEGKAEKFLDFEDRCTLHDTLILCRFYRDLMQWEELETVIRAAAGIEIDKQGLMKIAANVTDLARRFNLREGMTRDQDRLPPALLDRKVMPTGKSISQEQLDRLISDYYRLRGWNEKGEPPG